MHTDSLPKPKKKRMTPEERGMVVFGVAQQLVRAAPYVASFVALMTVIVPLLPTAWTSWPFAFAPAFLAMAIGHKLFWHVFSVVTVGTQRGKRVLKAIVTTSDRVTLRLFGAKPATPALDADHAENAEVYKNATFGPIMKNVHVNGGTAVGDDIMRLDVWTARANLVGHVVELPVRLVPTTIFALIAFATA